MKIINRYRQDFGFAGEANQMVGLALFIILLAFFIMLSGMSGFSVKKSDEALDSVRQAFGIPSVVYFGGDGAALRQGPQIRAGSGTSLQDIAGDFEHEVPGLAAVLVKRTGVLQMDIPISEMNNLLGVIDDQPNPALARLAAFMIQKPERLYDMQIIVPYRVGTSAMTQPMATETFLPIWRAMLLRAGVLPEHLSVGVAEGRPGTIAIIVHPRHHQGERP
jgi:hypothetical protein